MSGVLYTGLFVLPAVIALVVSFKARHPFARLILRWGGMWFCLTVVLLVILTRLCVGNFLKGFHSCAFAMLDQYLDTLHTVLVVSLLGYPTLGPLLLVCAALLERHHRTQAALAHPRSPR